MIKRQRSSRCPTDGCRHASPTAGQWLTRSECFSHNVSVHPLCHIHKTVTRSTEGKRSTVLLLHTRTTRNNNKKSKIAVTIGWHFHFSVSFCRTRRWWRGKRDVWASVEKKKPMVTDTFAPREKSIVIFFFSLVNNLFNSEAHRFVRNSRTEQLRPRCVGEALKGESDSKTYVQ